MDKTKAEYKLTYNGETLATLKLKGKEMNPVEALWVIVNSINQLTDMSDEEKKKLMDGHMIRVDE